MSDEREFVTSTERLAELMRDALRERRARTATYKRRVQDVAVGVLTQAIAEIPTCTKNEVLLRLPKGDKTDEVLIKIRSRHLGAYADFIEALCEQSRRIGITVENVPGPEPTGEDVGLKINLAASEETMLAGEKVTVKG